MFCGWLPKFYVQSLQPSLKICRSSFAEVSKSKSQSQVKQVQIWHILGVAGFYRNFILQKYWHLSPLQILKQKLSVYPILHFVDFDGEFILDADAKLIRFAASLMNIKAKYWPWSFVLAEFFSQHEIKYSMSELDFLAIVWALEYFWPYLERWTIHIISDYKAVVMKMTKFTSKNHTCHYDNRRMIIKFHLAWLTKLQVMLSPAAHEIW